MVRSLGRGLRLRFLRGGQSWRVESSPSCEDCEDCEEGVKYRFVGSGEDLGDEGTELRSEISDRSYSITEAVLVERAFWSRIVESCPRDELNQFEAGDD